MSNTGVPSMRSAPDRHRTGPSFASCRTPVRTTQDMPSGFGRNGERVANTPRRVLPPRRGGRTVGAHEARRLAENSQMSHRRSKPSMPRRASGLRNSGVKISSERSSGTTPLWRGMPNFPGNSLCTCAMGRRTQVSSMLALLTAARTRRRARRAAQARPCRHRASRRG